MSARKQPVDRGTAAEVRPTHQPEQAGDGRTAGAEHGPQAVGPWGSTGGAADRDPPWGVGEDSPLDEGSEPSALPPGRRGERRAVGSPESGRHGFGPVEPSRIPEAGPGAPPDPAPARRAFPDETATGDAADSGIEQETGMRPEGVARRE